MLKFAIEFENAKWVRTILRGVLLIGYFSLIPSGLLYLMNEFNKDAESTSFLWMFPITFLILIIFAVITIVSVLFNRPFLFDKISGTSYKSTVKNK